MAYFVTGATGFIGRYLVDELVDHRDGEIHVLCRASSLHRLEPLIQRWGPSRVIPVVGDLSSSALGVDESWVAEHAGRIDHFFHLAAIYDMTADDATNQAMNVGGTRHALELAEALRAGCFHQVSSVAAAGDYHGRFTEDMFAEGQRLPSPYHRTKYESEQIVREESTMPWRIYRPAIVLGHSETGAMDQDRRPLLLLPADQAAARQPAGLAAAGRRGPGRHQPGAGRLRREGDGPHRPPTRPGRRGLPPGQPRATACGRVDQRLLCRCPCPAVRHPDRPRHHRRRDRPAPPGVAAAEPVHLGRAQRARATGARPDPGPPRRPGRGPGTQRVHRDLRLDQDRAGPGGLGHRRATAGVLRAGAVGLLGGEPRRCDRTRRAHPRGTEGQVRRDHRCLLGHRQGHRPQGGPGGRHPRAGGPRQGQARGDQGGHRGARRRGEGLPCDLSDLTAIDALCQRLSEELPSVDYVVNNAGRSIRRSLKLSHDRFHDFERTMQLNYFGAIRLIIGLMPKLTEQRSGHIVNISSIGVQTNPPRFSAYVASKAALDAWSNVVSSEVVGNGISFTNVHMPLVRTPMIAPTKIYDKFPTISPAQAADVVIKALVDKPHELNTALGTAGELAHTVAPRAAFRVLNLAYQVFPDSAAAKGQKPASAAAADAVEAPAAGRRETEQMLLAQVFRGVHW